MRRAWTNTEERQLREHWASACLGDLGRELGRTPVALTMRARRLNLPRRKRVERQSTWTAAEDKFLADNWESMRVSKLAEKLGRTTNSIIGRAHRLGLPEISRAVRTARAMLTKAEKEQTQ